MKLPERANPGKMDFELTSKRLAKADKMERLSISLRKFLVRSYPFVALYIHKAKEAMAPPLSHVFFTVFNR